MLGIFLSVNNGVEWFTKVINKYKKKQTIYSEGNHPNRLYYILKGKVKAYKTNEIFARTFHKIILI